MLRENKRKLFLSSAVILLPVLFGLIVWNRLPGTLITHWGADGKADGSAAKALAVFGLPLAHLLVHLLCLCLTLRDPKQQRRTQQRHADKDGSHSGRYFFRPAFGYFLICNARLPMLSENGVRICNRRNAQRGSHADHHPDHCLQRKKRAQQ